MAGEKGILEQVDDLTHFSDGEDLNGLMGRLIDIGVLIEQLTIPKEEIEPSMRSLVESFSEEIGAQAVWKSWRDTMFAQSREVPAERRRWELLGPQDRILDQNISRNLIRSFMAWFSDRLEELKIELPLDEGWNEDEGLIEKYILLRRDGRALVPRFRFVLSPEVDRAAYHALAVYAQDTKNNLLAQDIRDWLYEHDWPK